MAFNVAAGCVVSLIVPNLKVQVALIGGAIGLLVMNLCVFYMMSAVISFMVVVPEERC